HPPRPTPFPYTTLFRSPAERNASLPEWGLFRCAVQSGICRLQRQAWRWLRGGSDQRRRKLRSLRPSMQPADRILHGGRVSALDRSEEHTSELQSPCNLV